MSSRKSGATSPGPFDQYFKSSFEEKLMMKMPEKESDHLTPATRLLEKRREMAEVETALSQQKEEFQMKMETLQQRRDELDRKEQELKESLLKFDKFLKENDLKQARAKKKIHAEQEMGEQKQREIEQLEMKIAEMKDEVTSQKATIKQLKIYQKFMDKVLEHTDEFEEASAIISRYETLNDTKKDLLLTESMTQDAIEKERSGLAKYTEDRNNEILGLNNELARLQTKLDEVKASAMKWDSEWNRIQTTAARKTLLLGQIKMATHNLYTIMYKHLQRKVTVSEAEDTILQLDRIQVFIQDLLDITNEIKKQDMVLGLTWPGGGKKPDKSHGGQSTLPQI